MGGTEITHQKDGWVESYILSARNNSRKGWMGGEFYGQHENNSPKTGELIGRHKNNSPKGFRGGELYGRHENNSPKDGELNGRH